MYKLLVFDLDGTLAGLGKGIEEQTLIKLKKLEEIGYRIAICSGKTTFYLAGFMRQVGLKSPILIGENGANIQFGTYLPPKEFYLYPYSEEAKKQLHEIGTLIEESIGQDVWYQPNIVGITTFPKDTMVFEKISALLNREKENLTALNIYRHVDSFDILPKEINKYNGLRYLSEITGITAENMIAIGDGINDIPMFHYAGHSIGIGRQLAQETDVCFENILDALKYIAEKNH